jgi:hypothetical protein
LNAPHRVKLHVSNFIYLFDFRNISVSVKYPFIPIKKKGEKKKKKPTNQPYAFVRFLKNLKKFFIWGKECLG